MKKSILSFVATIALAGMANAGSVVFDNFSGTFSQIQADNVAIASGTGFVAVGTTSLTPADLAGEINASGELSLAGRAALAADFQVFGNSVQFGFSGQAGYFQGNAQGDGGAAPFVGNDIILVAGNGASILESGRLLIMSGATFAADAPVFSSNIGPDAGAFVFGATGGTNSLAENFGAIQMGNVVPEPGVSILALLSAGIIFLRRRR